MGFQPKDRAYYLGVVDNSPIAVFKAVDWAMMFLLTDLLAWGMRTRRLWYIHSIFGLLYISLGIASYHMACENYGIRRIIKIAIVLVVAINYLWTYQRAVRKARHQLVTDVMDS